MRKQKIKRNFYSNPKYYHTALRFMVEIYRAKKKNVEILNIIKTQRRYIINAYYIADIKGPFNHWDTLRKIPITINMPILSKKRDDMTITVPKNEHWRFRTVVNKDLLPFYLSLRKEKRPDRGKRP